MTLVSGASLSERLDAVEREARLLEESPEQRRALGDAVLERANEVVDGLETRRAWTVGPGDREGLLALGIPAEPAGLERALELFDAEIDGPGLQPASGGHLGYIPGGGLFAGALGDLLAAASNRYSGVHYAGPGAVHVENLCLRWLRDMAGMPAEAHGTLTSGGSIATLVAVVAARDAHGIGPQEIESAVVYSTRGAHHCVGKALAIAGLGATVQRHIDVDERFAMDAVALERQVVADRAAGLRPFLCIASAGTTDTGAIDPIRAMSNLCKAQKMWLHVDGAYGGAFLLVDSMRAMFDGIGEADSVVVDPHKGLFLPYGSGAVLLRDPRHLAASNGTRGAYLQDVTDLADEPSPADLSPELTRHFRGLRMWLPLVLHGSNRVASALEEKHLLARYFHERAAAMGFELGPDPLLSVALFRWTKGTGDPNHPGGPDAFNRRLLQAVLDDGVVFLSSTTIDGDFWIRVAILSFRTHRDRVDHLLDLLAREVGA